MNSKHTPGPWNIHNPSGVDDEPTVVVGDDGVPWVSMERHIAKGDKRIAQVFMWTNNVGGWPRVNNVDEMKANANLISAAPELLEALEIISATLHSIGGGSTNADADLIDAAENAANAAIAKAKGESK